MSNKVQIEPGRSVRRVVTWPPEWVPYFPAWLDRAAPGVLYVMGHIKWGWSPTGGCYGVPEGPLVEFRDDGTWEIYDEGHLNGICRGTWSYVT